MSFLQISISDFLISVYNLYTSAQQILLYTTIETYICLSKKYSNLCLYYDSKFI